MITILLQKILDLLKENLSNMIKFFVTDPQDGQTLVYDAESEEWKNDYVELELQETASGSVATFDTDATLPLVSLKANITATQSGTGTPSPSNPRPISGFSSVTLTQKDSEDTTVDTFTISLGDTYYGGVLDCKNGTAKITHAKYKLSDLGTFSRYTNFFLVNIGSLGFNSTDHFICETFNNVGLKYDTAMQSQPNYSLGYSSTSLKFRYDDSTDVNSFLEAVGDSIIIFELATPIEITGLTPDNFTTIAGQNNIFADSGDVEVVYNTTSAQKVWDISNLNIDISSSVTVNTTDFSSVSYKIIRSGNVVMISLYSATVVNSYPEALFSGLPKGYNNANIIFIDTVSGDIVPGFLTTTGYLNAANAQTDQKIGALITYITKDEV